MLKNKILVSTISNFIGGVLKKCLTLLISIILIRQLSVNDFGTFNLFISMIMMLAALSLSISQIFQRFFPMYLDNQTEEKAATLLNVMIVLRFAVLVLIILIVFLINQFKIIDIARFNLPSHLIMIACFYSFFTTGHIFFSFGLNTAFMAQKQTNAYLLAGDVLKLSLLVIFFKDDLFKAAVFWGAGEIFTFALMVRGFYARLKFRIEKPFRCRLRLLEFRRYFNYGKYLILATGATFVLSTQVDFYFLSYYTNNQTVGLYAFASKIPFILLFFVPSNLMFNVVSPVLYSELDRSRNLKTRFDYITLFFKSNLLIWPAIACLFLLNIGPIIKTVFDEKYMVTIPYIFFWFVVLYIPILKNIFEPIARATEYTRVYLFTGMAAGLNIVLNFFLIPLYGIKGALAATGLSICLQGIGIIFFVCRKIGLDLNRLEIIPNFIRIFCFFSGLSYCMIYLSSTLWHIVASHIIMLCLGIFVFWPRFYLTRPEFHLLKSNFSSFYSQRGDSGS